MQVQGVGNQQAWQVFKAKQEGSFNAAGKTQNPQSTVAASAEAQTAEVSPDKGHEPGVVRLLSEGHFNGVADLRLRINFHEELQLTSSRQAGEALESGGQELVATLDSKIQEIGATFAFTDQVEGLVQNFEETVGPFLSGTKDGQFDYSAALSGIREAFGGLLGALEAFAPASAEESPAVEETEAAVVTDAALEGEEPVVAAADAAEVEGGASVPATEDFTLALQGLEAWFETEMTSLEKGVTDSLALPPLSEARGKGVAYNRFLEIYNGLDGGAGNTGEESGNSGVTGVQTEA